MKSKWDIDSFFKQKLADPGNETGYREEDWDALEKMIDQGKNRGTIIYRMPILSGVAAVLILALCWWLFKPATDSEQNKKQPITKTTNRNQPQHTDSAQITANPVTAPTFKDEQLQKKNSEETQREQGIRQDRYVNTMPSISNFEKTSGIAVAPGGQQNLTQQIQKEQVIANATIAPKAENNIAGIDTTKPVQANNVQPLPAQSNADDTNMGMVAAAAQVKKTDNDNPIFGRPQFALTVIGAPDINGVNSFIKGKTGTSFGLLFSANFNKVSVSTGIAYSFKPYSVAFADYARANYYFRSNPTDVLADCRMLDIPINVDYQVFNKNQNKISIGTGVSSYIMLRESYANQFTDLAARGPRAYAPTSPGNYLLGVVNFQATYKRQINSKVDLSLQPYLKLPLGNVGASKIRLQSAGVALGVNWNINVLKKR